MVERETGSGRSRVLAADDARAQKACGRTVKVLICSSCASANGSNTSCERAPGCQAAVVRAQVARACTRQTSQRSHHRASSARGRREAGPRLTYKVGKASYCLSASFFLFLCLLMITAAIAGVSLFYVLVTGSTVQPFHPGAGLSTLASEALDLCVPCDSQVASRDHEYLVFSVRCRFYCPRCRFRTRPCSKICIWDHVKFMS